MVSRVLFSFAPTYIIGSARWKEKKIANEPTAVAMRTLLLLRKDYYCHFHRRAALGFPASIVHVFDFHFFVYRFVYTP